MTQSEIASYTYDAASRTHRHHPGTCGAQRAVPAVVNGKTRTVTDLYSRHQSIGPSAMTTETASTSFARAGAETRYSYDANSNRLTAIDTASSDIDTWKARSTRSNFTQSTSQSLNIDPASNRLLGFTKFDEDAGRRQSQQRDHAGELQLRRQWRGDERRFSAHLRIRRSWASGQVNINQRRRSRRRRVPAQRHGPARLQERAASGADPAQ